MGQFTAIPKDAFDALQLDAGVLLKRFDIESPQIDNADIITATTGGIQISCTPSYEDLAEDVDNAPNGLKEFNKLTGWDCGMSTTSLGTSPELIQLSLGAADIGRNNAIIPRRSVELTDYNDLWWVGDKADGGFVACKIMNALSTGGFVLQTTKNGKGTTALELKGFVSIEDQDRMPMEFYSVAGETGESIMPDDDNDGDEDTTEKDEL